MMAPPARTPSSGAWRAGAHCIVGKGSRDRSPRRAWALRCDWPFAPRRAREAGRHPDVLDRLIAIGATDRLADTRDLAILLLAFASGGAPAQRSGAAVRRAAKG